MQSVHARWPYHNLAVQRHEPQHQISVRGLHHCLHLLSLMQLTWWSLQHQWQWQRELELEVGLLLLVLEWGLEVVAAQQALVQEQ